jgi:hypothetical protein
MIPAGAAFGDKPWADANVKMPAMIASTLEMPESRERRYFPAKCFAFIFN